jgi:Protein of unknown function (DUF669)
MASLNFNAASVAPQESIAPIPAGVYTAHITESDVRPLKSGNGQALALTFEVLDGPYARRKVWASLNIKHANQDAERIAQSQLSALCHAVGVVQLNDSVQLHMKPVKIRVKVRKDDSGQYGDRNEVGGYEAAGPAGAATGAMFPPAGGMPSASAPATAAAPAAPWARKPATV